MPKSRGKCCCMWLRYQEFDTTEATDGVGLTATPKFSEAQVAHKWCAFLRKKSTFKFKTNEMTPKSLPWFVFLARKGDLSWFEPNDKPFTVKLSEAYWVQCFCEYTESYVRGGSPEVQPLILWVSKLWSYFKKRGFVGFFTNDRQSDFFGPKTRWW